jgi:anti-sigma factor (TIGR02949 family)
MGLENTGDASRMNCSDVKKHCQAFLDKQLEPATAQAVESHIAECNCCCRQVESERSFLSLMKKCICRPENTTVPAGLKTRIVGQLQNKFATASASANIVQLPPPTSRRRIMQGPVATAAAIMLGFSGLVGFQSNCLLKQCPVVKAAQQTHDDIVAGAIPASMVSFNSADVTLAANKLMKHGGIPQVKKCELTAVKCGRMKLRDYGEGVYVQYEKCRCSKDPVTLMVVDSANMPGGDPVVPEDDKMRIAIHSGHRIVSWKNEENGLLYILVTKLPVDEAVHIAQVASR